MEYTVHFQKGTRVGARSLRMVHVTVTDPGHDAVETAIGLARAEFNDPRYRLTRVDHFDGDSCRIVIDR